MSCLILIGMMGAGKTTVGKELARRRKLRFADCDQEIVARTGVSIPTIFEIEGEAGFRKRETQMMDELTQVPDIVIATGGGVVMAPVNRELMQLGNLGCKFMHCLPATRGEDVTDEVADSAASLCWEQAGNRLTAMRGLLVYFTRCRRVPTELELAAAQEELDTFLDARLGGC